MKSAVLFAVLAACLLGLYGCGGAPGNGANDAGVEAGTVKVAVVTSGPTNDRGWNADALAGAERVKHTFGWDLGVSENISQADQGNVLRQYAQQDYRLIFAHGYEWGDALSSVAPDFPAVRFVQINSTVIGSGPALANLSGTKFLYGELGYFTGMAAGLMSRSGKIGVIAAQEAPQVTADTETFRKGVAATNRGAGVSVAFVGSWNDIVKGQQVAQAQIDRGVDVLAVIGNAFAPVVMKQAKAQGVMVIAGWPTDVYSLDPDAVITSAVQDVPRMYLQVAGLFKDSKLQGNHEYVFGFKEGVQRLGKWGNKVPPQVRHAVDAAIDDYHAGKLSIPLGK